MPKRSILQYQPWHKTIAYGVCALGATDTLLAKIFDISVDTLDRWKKKHPDFYQAIRDGKQEFDEKVERVLLKCATGYYYTELTTITRFVGGRLERTVIKKTEYMPPNVRACIFWLVNRCPERWKPI